MNKPSPREIALTFLRKRGIYLLLLPICAFWIALPLVNLNWTGNTGPDGALSFLENKTISARLHARGELPSPLRLCYVDVDSQSIAQLGNFPWKRTLYSWAIDALFTQGHAKAIGFDFVFSSAGEPNLGKEEAKQGSLDFGKSIRNHGHTVLAATYTTTSNFPLLRNDASNKGIDADLFEKPDFPVVGPQWGTIGLIDTILDDRYVPLFAPTKLTTYYHMSLQLALEHWGLDSSAISVTPEKMRIQRPDGSIVTDIPLTDNQLVEINWFLPWHSPQNFHVSFLEVLRYGHMAEEGTAEEKADAAKFFENFRDAIILVGPTDALLRDLSQTAIDGAANVPRVSIHGNMLKTLVSGRFIHRLPIWANSLLILLLGAITATLCLQEKKSALKRVIAGLLVLAYIGAAFLLFAKADILIPLVAPIGNALSCSFAAIIWQLGLEQNKRNRIKMLFGSYVSSEIVNEMVDRQVNPQVGGAEVEITAFFSDIEAFSPLSEELTPSELVDLMSHYLGECTKAITWHSGTLDKYVGDAIIAIFGAPLPSTTHAAAACHAALDVQIAQVDLREHWMKEGDRWPTRAHAMRTRIGLNTGQAVVGNLGSKLRFNYTMMGDNVNLTQRLEAAAGHFGVDILTSASTRTAATAHDPDLIFRHLDRVTVPGRNKPVEIHELACRRDKFDDNMKRCFEAYETALNLYFKGAWADALAAFKISEELERRKGKLNPSTVLIRRCERFLATPPPSDWNFAYKLVKGE